MDDVRTIRGQGSSGRLRVALLLLCVVAATGPVLNLILAPSDIESAFTSGAGRVFNSLSFFTNTTNLLVAITSALLVTRLRRGRWFHAMHLSGVIAIIIVGVVFHLLLADLSDPTGLYVLTNFLTHTLTPILAPLVWLFIGPRRAVDWRVVLMTLVYPLAWILYALIRGEFVDDRFGVPFYPYPFLNVAELGYATALTNIAAIAAGFVAMAALARVVDRRLPGEPVTVTASVDARPAGAAL